MRLPDKPNAWDLEAAGHGNPDSYDEDRNGVMILDELGTWLNSRSFQDKGRAALLDWLIHARKFGWDVYLIVQNAQMIDRQVREALIEYSCNCMRADKVKIPFIGGVLNDAFGGRVGYFPRMHMVAARLGDGAQKIVAERWFYRGDDLHAAYDTRQVFRADYPHGAHSVWHRPQAQPAPWWRTLRAKPSKPAPRAKPAHVQALAKLGADEAWDRARRYAAGLDLAP